MKNVDRLRSFMYLVLDVLVVVVVSAVSSILLVYFVRKVLE